MPEPRFLQIHTLGSHAAVLLNRDEGGFVNRLLYGGALEDAAAQLKRGIDDARPSAVVDIRGCLVGALDRAKPVPRDSHRGRGAGPDQRYIEFKPEETAYVDPFALSMFEQFRQRDQLEFDCVVPIPWSPDKAKENGKHRTRALARALGRLAVPGGKPATLASPEIAPRERTRSPFLGLVRRQHAARRCSPSRRRRCRRAYRAPKKSVLAIDRALPEVYVRKPPRTGDRRA